jgi:hypothetical protein
MGAGRKLGRLMLAVSRGADRMGDGLDMVFGDDRTKPGESFSMRKSGDKAAKFTRDARSKSKDKAGGFLDKNKDKDFFGKSGQEEDDERFI